MSYSCTYAGECGGTSEGERNQKYKKEKGRVLTFAKKSSIPKHANEDIKRRWGRVPGDCTHWRKEESGGWTNIRAQRRERQGTLPTTTPHLRGPSPKSEVAPGRMTDSHRDRGGERKGEEGEDQVVRASSGGGLSSRNAEKCTTCTGY